MNVGKRLRQARALRGFSLRDLGDAIGKSHETIRKYETGEISLDSRILLALAKALDLRVEYFFRTEYVSDVSIPAYRSHPTISDSTRGAVAASATEELERYLDIARILSVEDAIRPLSKRRVSSFDEVEEVAVQVRKDWNLGLEPIGSVVHATEWNGIPVLEIDTQPGFDACTLEFDSPDGRGNVVVLTRDAPGDRMRFSLAHELGHLALDCDGIDEEQSAHRFAAAFLVPRWAAISELGESRSDIDLSEVYRLKHRYGMSMQAWIHRAVELDVISHSVGSSLRRRLDNLEGPKLEPGNQLPRETPTRFRQMVERAHAEGIISTSKAAALTKRTVDYWLDPKIRIRDAARS